MRAALAGLFALVACGPSPSPPAPELPDADVQPAFAAVTAEECGACHVEHLEDFERSRHRAAFTGALFQLEWGTDHDPFCLPCHAPRVREDPWVEPERAEAGVDCASCHLRDGVVLATEVSGDAPHASRADPSLGTSAACASCHQISFPTQAELPLQNTVAEWRAAGEPAGACQTCHMPGEGDWHRHAWPGGHDAELIASALHVEAERRGGALVVTLHNEGAGHPIPTGDIFRRLVVRADGRRVELGRHLARRDGRWLPVRDDRVPVGGTRVVTIPVRPGGVEWSVELASQPHRAVRSEPAPRDRARRVAAGRLPSTRARPR